MSIKNFIEEIEDRKRRELESLNTHLAEEKIAIQTKKDNASNDLQRYFSNEARLKSEREAAKIVEAARLQSKKILFDAINLNLNSAFGVIKQKLSDYADSSEYKTVLKKMILRAGKDLGPNIRVLCREKDRSLLAEMGVTVLNTIQTIGGVIAENETGTRELDLTFEELLRIHEDEVKSSIMEGII